MTLIDKIEEALKPELNVGNTVAFRIVKEIIEKHKQAQPSAEKLAELCGARCHNPHCNNSGAYPVEPDGDAEQCEFCHTNPYSVYNLTEVLQPASELVVDKPSEFCSAHKYGEDKSCKICYPDKPAMVDDSKEILLMQGAKIAKLLKDNIMLKREQPTITGEQIEDIYWRVATKPNRWEAFAAELNKGGKT